MQAERDIHAKPFEQKVDYNLEEHFIYGNQKKWKKLLEWVVTVAAWLFILSYVIYLIYGSLAIKHNWYLPQFFFYTRGMITEIKKYFYILFIAALIFVCLLLIWKNYNMYKYGRLHRRKFKPYVTNDELAERFEISKELVEKMQSERYVVLEENIIPEDLGMGNKRKNKKNKKQREEIQM